MADKSSGGSPIRWIIRIIVVLALAYFFHPLYLPANAPQPASLDADDSVTIRFYEAPDAPDAYQELVLRGDGSNDITITRAQGDPDLPEGGGWKPTADKATSMIRFHKQGLLDPDKGKRLFQQLIDAGLLAMDELGGEPGNQLVIEYSIDGASADLQGPAFVERAYHWAPEVWKNQQRWQDVILLLKDDTQLRRLISKTEIELVNE